MSLRSVENKILAVMDYIKEQLAISNHNNPSADKRYFSLDKDELTAVGLSAADVDSVMTNLRSNMYILRDNNVGRYYTVEDGFEEYYEKIKAFCRIELETKEAPLLWLTYENQKILINNIFQIHKINQGSLNGKILNYLLINANKTVKRSYMQAARVFAENEDKDFHVFLNDIKMRGWLK